MYNFIIEPNTLQKYDINTIYGKHIIKKYLLTLLGGANTGGYPAHSNTLGTKKCPCESCNKFRAMLYVQILEHASQCTEPNCSEQCAKVKRFIGESSRGDKRYINILEYHVNRCQNSKNCGVPRCQELKDIYELIDWDSANAYESARVEEALTAEEAGGSPVMPP